LKENVNKEELKSFFEKEENGGEKVKLIDLDSDNKSAIIEFEDDAGENKIVSVFNITS
jgi:hypothetical protein